MGTAHKGIHRRRIREESAPSRAGHFGIEAPRAVQSGWLHWIGWCRTSPVVTQRSPIHTLICLGVRPGVLRSRTLGVSDSARLSPHPTGLPVALATDTVSGEHSREERPPWSQV